MKNFIIRTPYYKLRDLSDQQNMLSFFSDETNKTALSLASDTVYQELEKHWERDASQAESLDKLTRSLNNYYSRMHTRPTPFGLFAGLTVGTFENESRIKYSERVHLSLQLDMGFLTELYYKCCLEQKFIEKTKFSLNNTAFESLGKLKYIETSSQGQLLQHKLVAIEINPVNKFLLNELTEPQSLAVLSEQCSSRTEYELESVSAYLLELVKNQLLVSRVAPNVIGSRYQDVLIASPEFLAVYPDFPMEFKNDNLKAEEVVPIMNDLNKFQLNHGMAFEKSKIIKIDYLRDSDTCSLSQDVYNDILDISKKMAGLSLQAFDNHIDDYRQAFIERFDQQAVALVDLFDQDLGLPYSANHRFSKSKNRAQDQINWFPSTRLKFNKFKEAIKENKYAVEITNEEFQNYSNLKKEQNGSFAFFGNILDLDKDAEHQFLFQYAVGPNPTRTLGRFGYLDHKIESISSRFFSTEQESHSDKIVADISHIPQGRTGNVLARPTSCQYEISYLSNSCSSTATQIPVTDLFVAFRDQKLRLYSKKFQKEVIPYMNNSHNHRRNALPIYEFLNDLSGQYKQISARWSWEFLESEPFLPRVTHKKFVINPARWNIFKDQLFSHSPGGTPQDKISATKKFLAEKQVPQRFLVGVGDNLLLVDQESNESMKGFLKVAKKLPMVSIQEFLFDAGKCPDGYVNELVVPHIETSHNKGTVPFPFIQQLGEKALTHHPMGDWLSLKFYCSQNTLDLLVGRELVNFKNNLFGQNQISNLFFIRYSDPDHHIRIRIKLAKHTGNRDLVLREASRAFNDLLKTGLIWKTQIDTYSPETERYGLKALPLSEELFYQNSKMVMQAVQFNFNRTLFALEIMNLYMDCFGLTSDLKKGYCDTIFKSYLTEFPVYKNKRNKKELFNRFRHNKVSITNLFRTDRINHPSLEIQQIKETAAFFRPLLVKAIRELRNQTEVQLDSLLASHIHMFCNRLFKDNQRHTEMVLYLYLYKWFEMERHLSRSRKIESAKKVTV